MRIGIRGGRFDCAWCMDTWHEAIGRAHADGLELRS